MSLSIHDVFSLSCYNSDTFVGEERSLTEPVCPVNSVCMYYESTLVDGYAQSCAIPSYCATKEADTTFFKNVICCNTDLCNDASGQQQPSTPSSSSSLAVESLLILLLLCFHLGDY